MDRGGKYQFKIPPITFADPEKDPIKMDRFATIVDKDCWCRQIALWKSDSADMEIIVGDTVFKVHKTLLAIASGYFHKKLSKIRPNEGMHREEFPSTTFSAWEIETCLKDAYHLFDNNVDEHLTALTASTDFARLVYCADFLEFTSLCFDAPAYFLLSLKNPALCKNPSVVTETIKEVYNGIGGRVYLGKPMAEALRDQGLLKVIPDLGALFIKFPQFAIDLATVFVADDTEEESTSSGTSSSRDSPEQADEGREGKKGEDMKKAKNEEQEEKGDNEKNVKKGEQAEKAKNGGQGKKGNKTKKGGS